MNAVHFSIGLAEQRICSKFSSNLDRFTDTAKDYEWSNPLEAAAGATHVVTSGLGLDPAIRDIAGSVDGENANGVGKYLPYVGKTIENTAGTVGKLLRGKPVAAAASLINVVGDGISDAADFAAGVSSRRAAGRRAGQPFSTAA